MVKKTKRVYDAAELVLKALMVAPMAVEEIAPTIWR